MTYLNTSSKDFLALRRQAAITEVLDRSSEELHWLATVIVGHGQDAEICIDRAGQIAEDVGRSVA